MEGSVPLRAITRNTLFFGYNFVILHEYIPSECINLWKVASLLRSNYKQS